MHSFTFVSCFLWFCSVIKCFKYFCSWKHRRICNAFNNESRNENENKFKRNVLPLRSSSNHFADNKNENEINVFPLKIHLFQTTDFLFILEIVLSDNNLINCRVDYSQSITKSIIIIKWHFINIYNGLNTRKKHVKWRENK